MHCKNDSLESRDCHLACVSCVLPFSFRCPAHLCWLLPVTPSAVPAVAFSVVRQANWVNFCDLADVHGELRSGRLIFMCVQSQDFHLVKGCGIYFPKHCPNSVLLFFSCLLGLRWLLNALNYAGSLCIFEHLCVIQIMGGHKTWLSEQLLFPNGEIPRSLTVHRVWGLEQRLKKDGHIFLNFHWAM